MHLAGNERMVSVAVCTMIGAGKEDTGKVSAFC